MHCRFINRIKDISTSLQGAPAGRQPVRGVLQEAERGRPGVPAAASSVTGLGEHSLGLEAQADHEGAPGHRLTASWH